MSTENPRVGSSILSLATAKTLEIDHEVKYLDLPISSLSGQGFELPVASRTLLSLTGPISRNQNAESDVGRLAG